jgi:hypothetical protein
MNLLYLRLACLVLWVAAGIALSPSFARYVRGAFSPADEWKAGFFFVALIFIGGIIRWLAAPDDTLVFAGIYAAIAALAVHVLILVRQGRT